MLFMFGTRAIFLLDLKIVLGVFCLFLDGELFMDLQFVNSSFFRESFEEMFST